MPELPEVETTLRGIEPWMKGQRIDTIEVRDPRLRWPVPDTVRRADGQKVADMRRRAKYLLVDVGTGHLLMHLGMSGSLRVLTDGQTPE